MEETQKEKQAVPEPIDIITLLHDVLRGVKKLWWACLLLTVLCAAGSWYTAKRAYRPLYRAAASFTVATGSGESGGFSYGFYYNTATASQLARTFPYILESELLTDSIKQALGTDSITASLSASAVEDSNLFTLTATGANAESTLNVLNAAIDCYPEAARYVLGDIKLHMLSAPSLPTTPYNIFDGKRAALTGAAYGLLFGAGLILLYGCTRRTVRREEEIASKLHLLCLGTLPKVVFKKRSKNRRETLTLTNPHVPEHYREAARGLAMRLERRMAASGDKVLLFCGTLPGEGVRTTAMVAAHALGEMGKSVVLIDLDLKRGMDKRSPGLEACLFGHCPVQKVLHRRGAEPYRYAACSRGLSPQQTLYIIHCSKSVCSMTKDRTSAANTARMYRANARIFINPTQSSLCARARHTIASAPKSASSPFIRTASSAATTVIAATCPQRKSGRTSMPVCRMSFVSVCRSRAPHPLKTPFTAPSRSKTKRSKIRCF